MTTTYKLLFNLIIGIALCFEEWSLSEELKKNVADFATHFFPTLCLVSLVKKNKRIYKA